MKKLLQNHPHFYDFPVKSCYVMWTKLQQGEKLLSTRLSLLIASITILTVIGLGISFLLIYGAINNHRGITHLPIYLTSWGCSLIFLIIFILLIYQLIMLPKREQLRYYQQVNLTPLPLTHRQALRLNLVDDYYQGFWSETLEHYPLRNRIAHDSHHYYTFYLSLSSDHQSQLYQDWEIVDEADYDKVIEALWQGMHSKAFIEHMTEHDASHMIKALSTLLEVAPHYVSDCIKSHHNRPPALLWGFDLWCAITVSRNCFCANLISEEKAWQNILKTADIVHEIFDSFEAFYTNYRLGNAYWANDFELSKNKIKQYQHYQTHCNWPIRHLPWPAPNKVVLPDYIPSALGKCPRSPKIQL